jgi:hypothetical protein
MIAYMVQIHDNFDQASRLLSWISHSENLYIVMVDCSTPLPTSFLENLRSLPNLHVFHDFPCVWGGASMVAETFAAIKRALRLSNRWQAFINISGGDVPLKSQEDIFQALSERRLKGQRTFITDFGHRVFEPRIYIDESMHEFTEIPFRKNITFNVFGRARSLFASIAQSPIVRPEERISVHVYEDIGRKVLHVRPLFPLEQEARRKFFERYPFHFGRQWMILDRAICEWLCNSDVVAQTYECLKSVLIPDECFFQTLLTSSEVHADSVSFNDNLRYKSGGPDDLVDDDLIHLRSSEALFARKLNERKGQRIIEWVSENNGRQRGYAPR